MYEMLPKIAQARAAIGDGDVWLQVDGGISLDTIGLAAEAGADTFVAGSSVYQAKDGADPAQAIASLRAAASARLDA
jgi:ribulose-phosphate 3-epimerase